MVKVFNILLLEDDIHSAEVVVRLLEKYNFAITHCDNVRNALVKVKDTRYDLIISDIMMPAIDGFSFLEKAEKEIKNIPIIMLTALKEKQSVVKAVNLKVSAYIIKPFNKNDLLSKIADALKVEVTNFVLRKDYPFIINWHLVRSDMLEIIFSGIPDKRQMSLLDEKLRAIKEENSKLTSICVTVNEEFAYNINHIGDVEMLVSVVGKVFRISPSSIILKGKYFSTISFDHLETNSFLKDCQQYG